MNILFVHEVDWLNKVVFDIHSLSESLSLLGHRVYGIDYESMWARNNPFDFGGFATRETRPEILPLLRISLMAHYY